MRLLKLTTFAVLAMLALSSNAGYVTTADVFIGEDGPPGSGWGIASGSLRDARDSSDNLQYIGCSMEVRSSGGFEIFCQAQNSNGTTAYCFTSDPAHAKAVQMINSASVVQFRWDDSFECWDVLTITGSEYLP